MIIEALGRTWSWPDQDTKCRKVIEWSKDLRVVYKACRNFRVAIQAGGNMGVWPWLMAKRFETVYTYEPDPVCLPHLLANIKGCAPGRVLVDDAALLDRETTCEVQTEKPDNLGAQYVVPDKGKTRTTTIDSRFGNYPVTPDIPVDLIYLDIEGAELLALYGAVKTIAVNRPVIVVEDNGLSERFGSAKGDIEKWLHRDFGYAVVARPHRDVVMRCS